jgi:hypothetical protein
VLGLAASGNDPAALKQGERAALTVGELCNLYLAEGCATKKASTIATDRGRIGRHIKPLLGRTRIVDISRADIERFLRDVADGRTKADVRTRPRGRAIVDGGRGTATRTVAARRLEPSVVGRSLWVPQLQSRYGQVGSPALLLGCLPGLDLTHLARNRSFPMAENWAADVKKLVADKMKGDRTKNRVTVYYLLAEHFGKVSLFG